MTNDFKDCRSRPLPHFCHSEPLLSPFCYSEPRLSLCHSEPRRRWLRYHVEVYLQETYILFERLRRLLRRVQKVAIDPRDKSGVSSVKKLKTSLEASFRSVVGIRWRHVHEYRFQDDELKNLDTLVLLTSAGKMGSLRGLRRVQYVTALIKWREQLRKNNKATQNLCVKDILTRNEPPHGPSHTAAAPAKAP
jgi:hypothetical protein